MLNLTNDEFTRLAKHIYESTGIYLPEAKINMLSNRLRKRLRLLNLDTFEQYYELIRDPTRCDEEFPHFLSAVTTNETYFFRNENLWKYFRDTWIPEITKQKRESGSKSIQIWSAASSSGEEAYTAAMCLREGIRDFSTWKISITGTDISKRMLDKAQAGLYDDYAVAKMPKVSMQKWFVKRDDGYQLKDDVRKLVTFRMHNLRDSFAKDKFDFVFLRNVLMYFDNPMKLRSLDTVTTAMRCGARLIVGDVDPIRSTAELRDGIKLEACGPNLYVKPTASASLAGAAKGS